MAGEARNVQLRMRAAAESALRVIGNDLLGEAQRLAPVEEGTLRASGELDIDHVGDAVVATVSFNSVYAARQHEETEWEHPLGGQAKYLEQPLQAKAGRYEAALGAAIARALR